MKFIEDKRHLLLRAFQLRSDGMKWKTILWYEAYMEIPEAAKLMADVVIRELGDGDGENGGRGSLKNCYGEIVDCFIRGKQYIYADCTFSIDILKD